MLFGENLFYRRGCITGTVIFGVMAMTTYYTIEDLYKYMSQKLTRIRMQSYRSRFILFDLKTATGTGRVCRKKSTYNELKRELSQLKLKHFEASRRYEQEILEAWDARELKAGKSSQTEATS